jgi:hypothetical protein
VADISGANGLGLVRVAGAGFRPVAGALELVAAASNAIARRVGAQAQVAQVAQRAWAIAECLATPAEILALRFGSDAKGLHQEPGHLQAQSPQLVVPCATARGERAWLIVRGRLFGLVGHVTLEPLRLSVSIGEVADASLVFARKGGQGRFGTRLEFVSVDKASTGEPSFILVPDSAAARILERIGGRSAARV